MHDPFQAEDQSRLEQDILPPWLAARRWFAAKGAGTPVVRIDRILPLPLAEGRTAGLCLLDAETPGHGPQRYLLPLVVDPAGGEDDPFAIARLAGGVLRDGFGDDAVIRALIAGSGTVSVHRTQAADGIDLSGPLKRTGVEQSNSSVIIGDTAIFKLFRQVQPGTHPEIEIGAWLPSLGHFRHTPPLLGWLSLPSGHGETLALGVLQGLVPAAEDGWTTITTHLQRRLARFETDDAAGKAGDEGVYAWLRRLGRRLAELHQTLARPTGDAAFQPRPMTRDRLDALRLEAQRQARRVLLDLEQARPVLDPAAAAAADRLLAQGAAVQALIASSLAAPPEGLLATRIHGDFHLGQVLVAAGDAWLIDFEGEPMKPVATRREKHLPLRDLAGLLRSIAYAAAQSRLTLARLTLAPDAEARLAWLAAWEREATGAVMTGYLEAIAGCPAHPAEPAAAALLRLFLLDKGLYELGYELANRPDWVGIPLTGLNALLDGAPRPEGGTTRPPRMPFGAAIEPDGAVRFALWAPARTGVAVRLEPSGETLPMIPGDGGWYRLTTAKAGVGSRYVYVLDDGTRVPDPASRFQPEDVHGPSEVIDPEAYPWSDHAWKGRPWEETVLYELHIGGFTPEGTFRAAIARLDALTALGVTAIEIMPVADFAGARNWGYDGVLPFAPDSAYGRPEDLKALVDAAHARGLMVFLDVVYNHFGPDGNFLHAYAPQVFTDRHKTPWGQAINYDGADSGPVRDFIIHNALYWITEFHLDGLRLDAVHAILDDGPSHILEDLADTVRAVIADSRAVHLVLENDANQARFLRRRPGGAARWYDAQWNDDLHHGLHVAASAEEDGYYADYAGSVARLARSLAEGFAFQGDASAFRDGEIRGEPSRHLPPTAFVGFIQNHDQIGNRAFGDRLTAIAPLEAVRAVACLSLLAPSIPMLFMGEEWASSSPFPFFCAFDDALAEAVREGRRGEFAKFPAFQSPEARARIPDPNAPATAASARLDWAEPALDGHAGWLAWYRRILDTRRREIIPRLAGIPGGTGRHRLVGSQGLVVAWTLGDGSRLTVRANLQPQAADGFPDLAGRPVWEQGAAGRGTGLGPWAVSWSLAAGTDS